MGNVIVSKIQGASSFVWQKKVLNFDTSHVEAGTLLVEEVYGSVARHRICMYAYIVCKARRLKPIFMSSPQNRDEVDRIVSGYFTNYQIAVSSKKKWWHNPRDLFVAMFLWLKVITIGNLVKLNYSGQLIGDIIYDQYLAAFQQSTLHYFDPRLFKIVFSVVHASHLAKQNIGRHRPQAILVSHTVGISGAPLVNIAESVQIPIYTFKGGHYGTLFKAASRKEYAYSADKDTLAPLLSLPNEQFDSLFEQATDNLYSGRNHADAKRAYINKIFHDRADFAKVFGTNKDKKNIFIMLHAFTDYPHSHFKGMLFKDYYDWFIKTLEYAKTDNSVNWIVKQHPSNSLYPVQDVDWGKIEAKYHEKHIVFLPLGGDFNTQSIFHIGDAAITCVGSAGFEIPALGKIPSITAGDNAYANAGFAIFPKTIKEYHEVLSRLSEVDKLSSDQLKKARAFFIYTYQVSKIQMLTIPDLSDEACRVLETADDYLNQVEKHVRGIANAATEQLESYIEAVSQDDFRLLQTKLTQ